MKKIMFATLISASTAIMPGVIAADDVASQIKADEVLFDQTMKKLDLDGESLVYIKNDNYGDFINRYAESLDVWSRINPQMSMQFAMFKAGVIQFGEALDLNAIKAIGSSSKSVGKINNEEAYRNKTIYYTGDAKLTAPLYVLNGDNIKFKLAEKYIPGNVLFAIGMNLDVAGGWNALKEQLQKSALFSTMPVAVESSIVGSLQVPAADFFAAISGEYLLMATQNVKDGEPEIVGLLVVPDTNGTLSKVIKTRMANFEITERNGAYMFVPEGEKSFAPAWFDPGVKSVSGNVMLFSHPDVITAGEKNPLVNNTSLKPYIFSGFEGISYGLVNVQSDFAIAAVSLLMNEIELPCNVDALKELTFPKGFMIEKRLPDGYYAESLGNFSANSFHAVVSAANIFYSTMQSLQMRSIKGNGIGNDADYEEDEFEVIEITPMEENNSDKVTETRVLPAQKEVKSAPEVVEIKLVPAEAAK